jgi:ABC-type multidrug transport system ATPase subunit
MDEVAEICDRVLFLDGGKIASVGTPEELAASAAATRIRFTATQGSDDLIRLAEEWGLSATVEGEFVEVEIDEQHVAEFLQELAEKGIRYSGISLFKPTLEDYFIMLARRSDGNGSGKKDLTDVPTPAAGKGSTVGS